MSGIWHCILNWNAGMERCYSITCTGPPVAGGRVQRWCLGQTNDERVNDYSTSTLIEWLRGVITCMFNAEQGCGPINAIGHQTRAHQFHLNTNKRAQTVTMAVAMMADNDCHAIKSSHRSCKLSSFQQTKKNSFLFVDNAIKMHSHFSLFICLFSFGGEWTWRNRRMRRRE